MATATTWKPEPAPQPAFYRRRKKRSPDLIGQILLRNGDIAPQLLRKALKLQEERGGQLGRILVGSGACTEAGLARALLEQLQRSSERGHVSASIAARENPALAGLRVAASPVLTTSALLVTDTVALRGAALVGHGVELARTGTLSVATLPLLGLAVVVCVAAFWLLGLYGAMAPSPPDELRNATAATTLALSCVGAVTLLHGGRHAWSVPLVAATWASALFVVPLARALLRSMCAKRAWWGHPVVVLGAGKTGRLVVRTLRANPRCGLKPVMMLDDDRAKQGTLRADLKDDALELHSLNQSASELATPSLRAMSAAVLGDDEISSVRPRPEPRPKQRPRGMFAEVEGVPVVGGLALAPVLAEGLGVPYAIVAMPGLGSEKLASLVERVGGVFSHLLVIPDLFGLASLGVPARDVDGILGLEVRQQLLLPGPRFAKRVMDVVLTVLGGACILPVILLLAWLIRLDSKGTALYPQDRLGRDGRRFRALKFRTMHGDGEDAPPRRARERPQARGRVRRVPQALVRPARHARRARPPQVQPRRAAPALERAHRRHEPRRPAAVPRAGDPPDGAARDGHPAGAAGHDRPLAGGRPQRDELRRPHQDRRALRPQLVALARRVGPRAHARRRRPGHGVVMAESSTPRPTRPTRLRAGDVVAGRYAVESLVGQGASGEVWAARETATGTLFALKVLATEAATDDETVERFRREAYFLRRAQSVHVARIHDFVFDRATGMALVMELVEGEPLDRALEQRTLSVEEAIALGVDLLAGVEVLHGARVIHRDLKPGNILLREQEDGRLRPVICDFGLSRLARRRDGDLSSPSLTEITKGDVAMGTLRYMAPEQVLNARQATEQSDLYAVGAILYRAVTGVPAFGEHDEARDIARAKVMGEAPPFETGRTDDAAQALERVVTRAMRRRPAERFRSATEMREELSRAAHAADPSVEATERTSLPDVHEVVAPAPHGLPAATPARRSPGWTASAILGVLLVFAGGVATGRVWTQASVPGPVAALVAAPSASAPPPSIEAPEVLPEINELAVTSATAAPVVAPPVPVAAVQRPAPASTGALADDDNPY